MNIKTSRFGDIEIDKGRVIQFPDGLIGFPDDKEYIVMEHRSDSPFMWLQSVGNPDLAFVIINPFQVYPEYLKDISQEEENALKPDNNETVTIFAIVTIPTGKPHESTLNLMGPVVIDPVTNKGKQVILANSGYSHRHPVTFKAAR
ncbi:MAG: flagellar assembly protein FliW [Desulfatiglans sp.]|jgi:flagellar assembly factor FliW|nr:flagellar assembly protein FliW [Desulfatiglans sp.]